MSEERLKHTKKFMKNNEKKYAVVTGANRGIGAAIMKQFIGEGLSIIACARAEDSGFKAYCNELSETNSVDIITIFFDLEDESAVIEAANKIVAMKHNTKDIFNISFGFKYLTVKMDTNLPITKPPLYASSVTTLS